MAGWLAVAATVMIGRPLAGWAAESTAAGAGAEAASERWWSAAVTRALDGAGTNRAELERALERVPASQREGMQFLIEHMPVVDRRRLKADYLLDNVAQAYDAFEKAPWAKAVPKEVFLNNVLPYASLNESRDDWRRLLREKCATMITNCATPGEAAQALNRQLFKATGVRYSTQRRRADQGPLETLQSGMATCTGLSILLVDACRALGVPARVVATPLWTNLRGNHTWVEVWDGDWHFTGAAEPDPKGLNRGWFRGDAAQAKRDVPQHAIYASSFAATGLSFPMVWASDIAWVNAENVTDRYTAKAAPAQDTNAVRLEIKVVERPGGSRLATRVTVTDQMETNRVLTGTSRDETADLNHYLTFDLRRARPYRVSVEHGARVWRRDFQAAPGTNRSEMLVVALSEPETMLAAGQACAVTLTAKPALPVKDEARLRKAVQEYFAAPTNRQARWSFSGSLDRMLRDHESAVRQVVWQEYLKAPIHEALREDFATNRVRFERHVSPYTVKTVGARPAGGWPLFIAMHGGGGAPKQVNDSQWQIMQRYYKDHPEVGGYKYLALRAPNDTWNGFYDVYVYPLIENLIRQFVVFGEVDPDKVFIMGYSHGGYGAYAIGPKMPDRFAAIHSSAAAGTDGETTPKTLRNTVFTAMVGEKDTMYGRYDRNKKFKAAVEELRGDRKDIYPVTVDIIAGNGHTGLPDRDKIVSMYPAVRQTAPRELTWLQTDKVIRDFFWLQVPSPAKKQEINAAVVDNKVTVTTTTNVPAVTVFLDGRLVDFAKPVTFVVNGRETRKKLKPDLQVLCESMQRRGDLKLAFAAKADFVLAPPVERKK